MREVDDTDNKEIRYDVDGYDAITAALRELLNQFPGLEDSEEISFSTLGEDEGISMFPISGAVIQTENQDVTGHVKQTCLYPFYIIYRVAGLSENNKAVVKEWLDSLGKWLEKQPVNLKGEEYTLEEYPRLTGTRKFTSIFRQTPGYLDSINENKSENWAIYITAEYENEFYR